MRLSRAAEVFFFAIAAVVFIGLAALYSEPIREGARQIQAGASPPFVGEGARPTTQPAPTPVPPSLKPGHAIAVVAETLAPAQRVDIPSKGAASYEGEGRWKVTYQGAEWEVIEKGYKVFPMNGEAQRYAIWGEQK